MRIKYLLYILFLALIISAKQSVAQTPSLSDLKTTKVSQLTDEQLTELWGKAQDKGLSEQDIYKLMEQNGADPTEIQNLKERVNLLGLNKKTTTLKKNLSSQKKKIDFSRDENDTVVTPNTGKPKPVVTVMAHVLNVYGTEFFNQSNIKFEPNFSVATPKGYVLGPGDDVIVLLTGLNESTQTIKVSPEGNLAIDHAGITYVNGFTIEQATNIIKSKMAKVYPALNSGQ